MRNNFFIFRISRGHGSLPPSIAYVLTLSNLAVSTLLNLLDRTIGLIIHCAMELQCSSLEWIIFTILSIFQKTPIEQKSVIFCSFLFLSISYLFGFLPTLFHSNHKLSWSSSLYLAFKSTWWFTFCIDKPPVSPTRTKNWPTFLSANGLGLSIHMPSEKGKWNGRERRRPVSRFCHQLSH
jgi:hypothetical protein